MQPIAYRSPLLLTTEVLARIYLVAFGVASLFAIMGASQSQAYYAINGGSAPPWSQSLLWAATQWYAWALLVPWVCVGAIRCNFWGALARPVWVLVHVVLALTFATAHLLLQFAVVWFLLPGGRQFLGSFGKGVLSQWATTVQWEILSYAMVLAATYVVLYLRQTQSEALARKDLETQAAASKLAALKRQMQPHFLFNMLNALVSMQREDSPEQRFTVQVSDLLRLLLDREENVTATLANELTLVNAYLDIERVRLGARLRTRIDVAVGLDSARLPAMILLPLIENSVTHGIAPTLEGGALSLSARRDKDRVVVEIENSMHAGPSAGRGNGIALENCKRRLVLMYGDEATFEAGVFGVNRFRAVLAVPAEALERST